MHSSKHSFWLWHLLAIAVVCTAVSLQAAEPRPVNYQGRLTNAGGTPLAGIYSIQFKIYDAAVGGATIWSETQAVTADANGLFTVLLGSVTPLPDTVLNDTLRYLGITVGADPEMTPRTRLSAVGYGYASIPGENRFESNKNSFLEGLGVGGSYSTSAELTLEDARLAFRRNGAHRWRISENSTTGLQFMQLYNDDTDAISKVQMEIGDSGTVAIGATPFSRRKLFVYDSSTTTGTDYGIYVDNPSSAANTMYGVFSHVRHVNAGVAGSTAMGVYGSVSSDATNRTGVRGYALAENSGITTGSTIGVAGYAYDGANAYGVYGTAGSATNNYAGYFTGDVTVSGTLSKGGGAFKIDHPLDPANKYLQHSFVESPDMKNIYDGVVTTDARGFATVTMPAWFSALNRDFRYQLTCVGQFAQAIVSQEMANDQFTIQTDKPQVKVSWMVTGIRKDRWAEANRIQVEVAKRPEHIGLYLHPSVYGFGLDKSVDRDIQPKEMIDREKSIE